MKRWSLIAGVSAGETIRPTWVEVDRGALRDNARALAELAGASVYAVVKADAYGHGAVPVAQALSEHVAGFAVSLVEEGIELREAQITKPILVMGPALEGGYHAFADYDMTALVSRRYDLDQLAALPRCPPIHLKVDTGMGRLGFHPAEAMALVTNPPVPISGLATHFASADDDDPTDPESPTNRQIAGFERFCAEADPHHRYLRHAANSAATLRYPRARLDVVRPGIAMYGNTVGPVRQAVRLCTRIAQLRDIAAGSSVSYGGLWTARTPARVAVLPIGYADGYPRALTGRAEVLIAGRRCPVVGAISMDMTIADVTALGDAAQVGDEVVLLGGQADEAISVAEFAERSGLLAYEVTCGISKRVPRHYP